VERIGFMADVHANLPATRSVLDVLEEARCDEVIHVGDAVGIGPHPAEVVSLLVERGVRCLMGNHDELAAFGIPEPLPRWMSVGEAEHQHWTRSQLSDSQLATLKEWPYEFVRRCGPTTVACVHYADKGNGAFDYVAHPSSDDLLRLYEAVEGDVIVFGHDHQECDLTVEGRRFLNPGSVGCHEKAEARALVIESVDGTVRVEKITVPYDDTALLEDFENRQVPERDFILRTFIRRE